MPTQKRGGFASDFTLNYPVILKAVARVLPTMKPEFDALLCERYPLIFADRRLSIKESCMARGFACGDGWFPLLNVLCERLQFWTDHNGAPQVVASQVKEKWGVLSFHAPVANDWQRGMIVMAESMSGQICEQCGQPGQVLVDTRLVFLTRCQAHAPEGAITLAEFYARQGVPGTSRILVLKSGDEKNQR